MRHWRPTFFCTFPQPSSTNFYKQSRYLGCSTKFRNKTLSFETIIKTSVTHLQNWIEFVSLCYLECSTSPEINQNQSSKPNLYIHHLKAHISKQSLISSHQLSFLNKFQSKNSRIKKRSHFKAPAGNSEEKSVLSRSTVLKSESHQIEVYFKCQELLILLRKGLIFFQLLLQSSL